jgi:hypothetical protein
VDVRAGMMEYSVDARAGMIKYSVDAQAGMMKSSNVMPQATGVRKFMCFVITLINCVIAEFLKQVPWQHTY